jgi:hypothetical protein
MLEVGLECFQSSTEISLDVQLSGEVATGHCEQKLTNDQQLRIKLGKRSNPRQMFRKRVIRCPRLYARTQRFHNLRSKIIKRCGGVVRIR